MVLILLAVVGVLAKHDSMLGLVISAKEPNCSCAMGCADNCDPNHKDAVNTVGIGAAD